MGKRKYYKQWLYIAFRHTIGVGDGVAFFIGVIFPIVLRFIPNLESIMTELLWQIPLGVFLAIVILRLMLAPYWIYEDMEKERDELRAELQKDKNTPKLPSPPDLYLDYRNSKVGIENDAYIVTVSAWYRSTRGKMRVSHVKLCLISETIAPLDWKIIEVSPELYFGPDTKFKLPVGISSGEHNAELFAFANEQWWGPYAFTISVPEIKH